jgi:tight adherence protein C
VDRISAFLEGLGALSAGAAVGALALWGLQSYQRFMRLSAAAPGGEALPEEAAGSAAAARMLRFLRRTLLAFLAAVNERLLPARHLDLLRGPLRRAGHPAELTPAEIAGLMEIAAAFFLLVGMVLWTGLGFSPGAVPLAALFGASYPLLWLRDKVKARQHAITRALPYDLDLLTLSVEAGLDFAGALSKVVEKGRKGPLADELSVTLRELQLGKTREEALRNLAGRLELAPIVSFVAALVQADKMGTPLGKVLRILSTQMRVERTQRAEKLANEAPVKMLAPLIGCIFPTIFLMLFGPIAYQMFFGGQ